MFQASRTRSDVLYYIGTEAFESCAPETMYLAVGYRGDAGGMSKKNVRLTWEPTQISNHGAISFWRSNATQRSATADDQQPERLASLY